MAGKRFKGKPCVYCTSPSETGDHVLARTFFPVDLRENLPQVPSCSRCNAKKSLLEGYLTATLPLAGNHNAASRMVESDVARRLTANARLQREIEDGFESLAHVSSSMHATTFRGDVLSEYSAWVARGLLFHEFGVLLGNEYLAKGTTISDQGNAAFDQLFKNVGPEATPVVREFAGGALVYRGFSVVREARLSAWQVRLYGGINLGGGGLAWGPCDLAAITIKMDSPIATGELSAPRPD
ncbi:hypothetical protein [Dyella sp. Tek66A03]|uniref:hypothetical protein n=1 Tax=Dyella sp. Tek66A03 TaxID=3458298 RepID=UPI00403E79C8